MDGSSIHSCLTQPGEPGSVPTTNQGRSGMMLSENKIIAALHESLEIYFRLDSGCLTSAEQRDIAEYLESAINALQEQEEPAKSGEISTELAGEE
jgi:hypothetical protein